MFSKMTIRLRLGLMMAGIGVLAVIVGVTGLIGMRHANTRVQDGYAVQMAGTVALAESDSNLLSFRIVLDRAAMAPNAPGMEKTIERAQMFLDKSDAAWKRYRALPTPADERKLADEAQGLRDVFLRDGAQVLMQAVQAHDEARINKTVMDVMQALYRPLGDKVAALNRLQMDVAKTSYEASQAEQRNLSALTTGLQAGVDASGVIVANDRDRRSLAWLREQVGDAAIEAAVAQLAGQRRPYVSNVAKALGIAIPSDLALTSADTARARIAALRSLIKKK